MPDRRRLGRLKRREQDTKTNCYDDEGTIKFETICRRFANEILNVSVLYFTKELYNFVFKKID